MKYYDSKHSGAVAEQMLDDYVAGNLGGEGGAKVYHWNPEGENGTITLEEYNAIKEADVVVVRGYPMSREFSGEIIILQAVLYFSADVFSILRFDITLLDGEVLWASSTINQRIPKTTSQLTNDSGFITAEESPKIYHMATLAGESGTISQEVYDAILAADVVVYSNKVADVFKDSGGSCTISCIYTLGATVIKDIITITEDLSYTFTQRVYTIPTTTSELTNDSDFITAADIPPSGGLPTEVIELSSEVTLQEGKMLEINMTTTVTGALALQKPTITDATQGILFGIRFNCGASVPQLTLGDALGFASRWVNGEPPLLEAHGVVEIIGVRMVSVGVYLLAWAIYKS